MIKEKGENSLGSRTYLIDSMQLQDLIKYLMTRPYGEVANLMNMLSRLNQLDPKIGADFVKKPMEDDNAKK
jgi:hypothetical protein